MELSESAKLVRLSDTDLSLERAEEDVRGYKVVNSTGEDIGHVDDLMIDDQQKKVRFLVVAAGGFLGIGEKKFWVPVDTVTNIIDGTVHVDMTIEHVKSVPVYDPEVVHAEPYASEVYTYYGIAPYWGSGYVYPPYPYIMGGPGTGV